MKREEICTVKDTKGQRNARRITDIFSLVHFDWISFKNTSTLIVRKLFWASIYLGGVVMTFLSCLDLHQQYQQYPISAKITTLHNKTITPPDASICLPFDNGPKLMEYFRSYPSENNPSVRYFYDPTEFFTNVTRIFFHENPTWQAVQEAQWPPTIIFLVQHYFAIIFESITINSGHGNLIDDISNGVTSESLVLRDHFIPQLDEWKVTLGQFILLFGEKFLEFYPVTATLYFDNRTKKLDNFQLLYVTQYQICYKLKLADIQLGMDDHIKVEVDSGNTSSIWVPDSYFDGFRYFNQTIREPVGPSPSFPFVMDLSGTLAFAQGCNPPLCFSCTWEQYKLLMVSPSIEYISLPVVRGTRRCSLYTTRTECENECRQKLVGILCNCTAGGIAMQKLNISNFSGTSCLVGHYDICLAHFTQKDVYLCENQCLDICTNWKYDIQTEEGDIAALPEYSSLTYIWYRAVFIMSVFNYDYILFQETDNWTMETIIGSIGGILGFWLGLDIVTIIYTILSKPILLLIGKKQVNNNTVVEELQQNFSATEERGNKLLQKLIPIKWRKKFMDRENIKWTISKTIWSGLFVAGAILTTQMYIKLYQSYQQNGTTSFATVMFNQTMTLPPTAICMAISEGGYEFSESGADYHIYQQSKLDAFRNQDGMSKEMILSSNTTWPRFFSFMAFFYLRAISRILEEGSDSLDPQKSSHRLEVDILRQTRNILLKYSLTEEEIKQKFAIEFEKVFSISTICENIVENTTIRLQPSYATVEISPPSIIPGNSVCLHYLMNNFLYRSVDDRCIISVTKPRIEGIYLGTSYYLTVKSAFSPQLTPNIPFDDSEKLQYQLLNVTFDYSEIYQSINYKERNNCSVDNTPPITCMTNCRQEWAANWCKNCTITLPRNTVKQQCSWDVYRNCLSSISITNVTKSCRAQCFHACTLPTYSINSIGSGNLYYTNFTQLMDIRIKNFIYPLMIEQQAMTKDDFVAASGGVLGFWLGLDASYLVSIVFTPVMIMVGVCIRKLKTFEERTEEETHTYGIKHRLVHVFSKLLNIEFAKQPLVLIIKSLFERVFWLSISAFFGYLTVQLCFSYCQQIINNPVASSFQKMLNQTITFPMTTLCVPLDKSLFESYNEEELQEYVFMEDLNMNLTMFDGNLHWPISLLQVVQQYLAMVDRYKLMNETDLRYTWSKFSNVQQQQQQQLVTLTTAVDIFAQTLEKLNITYSELLKKFTQELLEIFVLKVSKHNSLTFSVIMNATVLNRITLVADTQICYEIPAGMVFFSSQYETISFHFEITKYFPPSTMPHGQLELPPNASWCLPTKEMTIDLPGRVFGAAINNFLLTGHLTKTSAAVIDVADVIRILPEIDGKKRCSRTTTPAMCKEECAISAVEERCGCTPEDAYKSDSKKTKTQKKCTWFLLKNCMTHYSAVNVSICVANCPISCELVRYTSNTIRSQQLLLFPNETYETCSTEITLRTTNFQYPIYSETFAFGFYNFVASLGGLLAMYLGIDLILLFEWIFEIKRWISVIFSKPGMTLRRKSSVVPGENRVRIILPASESP